MFRGMPMPVLAKLVHILERTTYKGGHMVVQLDQHGTAMFAGLYIVSICIG